MQYSKSEQQILKYLSDHTGETLYESEIAKNTGISGGSCNQSLKTLLEKDMVSLSKKGKMNFYILNLDNPLVRQFKVTQTIFELNGLINQLKQFCERVILFGSCAEGVDTPSSDIDLCLISSQKEEALKLVNKQKTLRDIQALVFKPAEFMSLEEKDSPLYERIQKGIELWRK